MTAKQVGHGEAQVSYGGGEEPRYAALRHAIDGFYADLLPPLVALRAAVFRALPLSDPAKAAGEPFTYTEEERQLIDDALEIFLTEMAGPDRSREGFVAGGVASDTADGVLQQRSLFSYAVGVRRGASLLDAAATVETSRQSPTVQRMLDHAFERLSERGTLRLEGVRDEIHSVLTAAADVGLSPIETGRQLARQFDEYQGWEFQRLARTEAAFAAEAGTRDQLTDLGVTALTILISDGACPICQAYDGQTVAIDDTDNLPPYHPNCLCSCAPAEVPAGAGNDQAPAGLDLLGGG